MADIARFPHRMSPRAQAALAEQSRAAGFRSLCGAVLSMADELRAWNAVDVAYSHCWREISSAASRMATEVQNPFNLSENEGRDFFEALHDLARSLSDFADELRVLAARGRK